MKRLSLALVGANCASASFLRCGRCSSHVLTWTTVSLEQLSAKQIGVLRIGVLHHGIALLGNGNNIPQSPFEECSGLRFVDIHSLFPNLDS
jgi:hypothetical protein